jgi:hypothetical protein
MSYAVAASIVGTARKNENSVADARLTPNTIAPMIVAPARETPGIIDTHWASPILSARPGVIESTSCTVGRGRQRSMARIAKPPSTSAIATTSGENSTLLM